MQIISMYKLKACIIYNNFANKGENGGLLCRIRTKIRVIRTKTLRITTRTTARTAKTIRIVRIIRTAKTPDKHNLKSAVVFRQPIYLNNGRNT